MVGWIMLRISGVTRPAMLFLYRFYHIGVVLVLSDERSLRPEAAYVLGLRAEKLP